MPESSVGVIAANPDSGLSLAALQPCERVKRARHAERLYVPFNLTDSLMVRGFVCMLEIETTCNARDVAVASAPLRPILVVCLYALPSDRLR